MKPFIFTACASLILLFSIDSLAQCSPKAKIVKGIQAAPKELIEVAVEGFCSDGSLSSKGIRIIFGQSRQEQEIGRFDADEKGEIHAIVAIPEFAKPQDRGAQVMVEIKGKNGSLNRIALPIRIVAPK
jgi:hypothetical protein